MHFCKCFFSNQLSLQKRNNQNSFFVGISFASKKVVWALQGRVYRIMMYGHVLGFRVYMQARSTCYTTISSRLSLLRVIGIG
jgi:hypothetical protein